MAMNKLEKISVGVDTLENVTNWLNNKIDRQFEIVDECENALDEIKGEYSYYSNCIERAKFVINIYTELVNFIDNNVAEILNLRGVEL